MLRIARRLGGLPTSSSRGYSTSISPPLNPKSKYSPLVGNKTVSNLMDEIVRVDHAGEYGAMRIYAGQIAVLGNTEYKQTLKEMQEGERIHLATFNQMLHKRRVRPTALTPLWHVTGYALGYGTALLGPESAMACTQAVEEVISDHYNEQLRTVIAEIPEDSELRSTIRKFRDDEQEHHDIAIENKAEMAPLHKLLYNGIKLGTQLVVKIATKI